jgi:hypothetical protein
MSVLNIFQISRERLFIFFHDNDHNDALSLTDRKYAPLCMYSVAYLGGGGPRGPRPPPPQSLLALSLTPPLQKHRS